MGKKKVLITYASYGSGHKSVATSLYDYFLKKKKYEVKLMDFMDYENALGHLSKRMIEQNVQHKSSIMFSLVYELFDKKITTLPYKPITKSLFKNKRLKNDIVEFQPDILITSHFFGSTIMASYNNKKLTNCKIITILTDYASHEMWIKDIDDIDALIVGNDIIKNDLVKEGIKKNKIYPYGIPIIMKYDKNANIISISSIAHSVY